MTTINDVIVKYYDNYISIVTTNYHGYDNYRCIDE